MKTRYVINIDNGTVSVRTSAHAENPFMFRPIDRETATAIGEGRIKSADVIEAIEKIERNKPGFNWKEYDRRRHAAERILNVSRREMIPETNDPDMVLDNEKADREEFSLSSLGLAEKPKSDADEKAKKVCKKAKEIAEKPKEAEHGTDDHCLGLD